MSEGKVILKIRKPHKLERVNGTRMRPDAGEPDARFPLDEYEEWLVAICAKNRTALSPRPSAFILEMCVPMMVTQDFLANLREIFETTWVPKYGYRRAKLLWHRQCFGLIALHWFNVFVTAAERLRKAVFSWG